MFIATDGSACAHRVTVRALNARRQIRDLGRPTLVRVGPGGRILGIVGRG